MNVPPFKIGYMEGETSYWVSSATGEHTTEDDRNAVSFSNIDKAIQIMAKHADPKIRWFMEMDVGANEPRRFFSKAEMESELLVPA